jgi:hypothetical protein
LWVGREYHFHMSHNTPLENAEFRVAFTETNLRYLLSETPQNPEKIANVIAELQTAKNELELLKNG